MGVVVGWSAPLFTAGVEAPAGVEVPVAGAEVPVAGAEVLVVGGELPAEPLVELEEDPHPAPTTSAAQAISVDAPRFIAARTLA